MTPSDLPKLISDTGRVLRTVVDQRARCLGLTRAQGVILFRLMAEDGLRQVDLAGHVEVEPITLARLVDRLEQTGYVTRRVDAQDRRVKRVYLTDAGRHAQAAFREVLNSVFTEVLAPLGADHQAALYRDLEEIKTRLAAQLAKHVE